ncbi:MAG: class I SAM-dependent methyltransferase [Oceanospirillaceae bacterium]|nr:class I SAM-dependent methyltransferase [Oceanospirillaceae bacterium]MCP5350101.1 class I SAM-dependent methyltransferase [Oceanospirillaceae bacterium]
MKYKLIADDKYGFKKISPVPSSDEIAEYYANEFYASYDKDKINDSSLSVQQRDKEFYDSWRIDLADAIEEKFPGKKIKVFDFGCGWCETIGLFNSRGHECYGIDTAIDAIDHGIKSGFNVAVSDLVSLNPFDKKYDLVIMQNVLEHLADPEAILSEIFSNMLNDGGFIYIDVPNEFNAFQVAGEKLHKLGEWWVAPPAHLNYFSADSIQNLLVAIGFEINDVMSSFPLEMFLLMGDKYVGNSELGRLCHEKRMAFEKNLRDYAGTEALHTFYRALASVNLGRQVMVMARKPV